MNHLTCLSLFVALGLCACDESESRAEETSKKFSEAAKQIAREAREALSRIADLDVGKLVEKTPDELEALGSSAMTAIAAQLDAVKDHATAERARSLIEPLLDKLAALKNALRGHLPDAAKVYDAMQSMAARVGTEVMAVLQPLVTRLQNLAS
jgi:uncharacterized protein YaaN involved in tellurite resistance